MEKLVKLLSIIIILAVITLIVVFEIFYHKNGKTSIKVEIAEDDNCSTPACIDASSTLMKYMDPTVHPCDDFYQFACGNFLKNTDVPDDTVSVNWFTITANSIVTHLKNELEEPLQKNEAKASQLPKKFYRACMNETIEKKSLKTMTKILKELGAWPVLEEHNWKEELFDWKEASYKLSKVGYNTDYFINFAATNALRIYKGIPFALDQASLSLGREFLVQGLSNKFVKAYYKYMLDVAVLLGGDEIRATDELKEILNFEISLAGITLPNEERRNFTALYNPMTVTELLTRYPSIPWLEYLNNHLSPYKKITNDEILVVKVILISRTPKRVLANYIMWRVIKSSVPYLSEAFTNSKFKYLQTLTGQRKRMSRWKKCIWEMLRGGLRYLAEHMYTKKYLRRNTVAQVLEIATEVRAEFQDILEHANWMDKNTKNNAIQKVKAEKILLSLVDKVTGYEDLEVDENDYLGSYLNLTLFKKKTALDWSAKLFKSRRESTNRLVTIINAFHSFQFNSIVLGSGVLQGVFFNESRPYYMNYASIGFLVGHEITHGFDEMGKQFGKSGNLVNWWAPESEKVYLEKVQCIIDQYGNYTVPQLNITLDGVRTQGENIADNGGMKAAYLAYNKWVQQYGYEKGLPGLNYTLNQMFWISAANLWCQKDRPEALRIKLSSDTHSPGRFRVMGSFSNSEYFAKDFNCPIGSKMNPPKKCDVW